jgi:hypothetical protein
MPEHYDARGDSANGIKFLPTLPVVISHEQTPAGF